MKSKTLIIATFLTASLAIGSTAQAHDDYGYPMGLLSGVILGLSLDGDDYYYSDRHRRHYHHRDYRRHDSHGYRHRSHYKSHHRHDRKWHKRHHKHHRKHHKHERRHNRKDRRD